MSHPDSYPNGYGMSLVRFSQAKRSSLERFDLSKKGSVDNAILSLVEELNSQQHYFTTSSCSGRIIVVANSSERIIRKKGCDWLYVTHEEASKPQLKDALVKEPHPYTASFKFEPMIMHVQCSNIESAQKLMQTVIESGYRNSGLSIGNSGRIILAVRSTAGMEVPLIAEHKLIVTDEYLEYLVQIANEKMKENLQQISRLGLKLENLQDIKVKKASRKKKLAEKIVFAPKEVKPIVEKDENFEELRTENLSTLFGS
ncbi:tRNA wybutosine-synthesizing protein 3 homolog [Watersipora subatra]|uniref:tRNA wybutosine-synthesizing protein 3 homolog n=1 Tax=Watersipora subatra TaxID=2589382 RepID=UPI00355B690E